MRRQNGVNDNPQRHGDKNDCGGREKLRAVLNSPAAAGTAQFIPTQKNVALQLALKSLRAVNRRFLTRQRAQQLAMQDQVLEQSAGRRVVLEMRLDLHALGR